jgi:hypothetical protein
LKELAFVQTPTLDAIAMFEREAKFLRALEHPAIPRFRASFEEGTGVNTRYYLAQELVTGESLAHKLDDHFFTETEVLAIARQVLEVLVYLQSLSPMVIHRDIKPANLIQKPDGTIAVVDFGAAHVQGTTAGSTSIGTFGYMPIEQLAGQVDATTDVYALGASLIHLLSRHEPWRLLQGSSSLEGINVSRSVRDFLQKIVNTDPAHRFPNAQAALAGLDGAVRGDRILPIAQKPRRRYQRSAVIAAGALGVAAAGYGAHALTSEPVLREPGEGTLMITHDPSESADLWIDGASYGRIGQQFQIDVSEGWHDVRIGPKCAQRVKMEADGFEFITCNMSPADLLEGSVQIDMVGQARGKVFVDNQLVDTAAFRGSKLQLPSGLRTLRVVGTNGASCEHKIEIHPQKTVNIVCDLGAGGALKEVKVAPAKHLPVGKPVDLDFKQVPLHDVLRVVSQACELNVVVPDYVEAKVTARLKQAPCDQVLEVILESHNLWYRYEPAGNLVLIAPRQQIERAAENVVWRAKAGLADDALPQGPEVDLDFKDAPLHDLLRMFGDTAAVNIIAPEHIAPRVTVYMKKARWDAALTTILEAHNLWYRYRPNGKLLRIAPRQEIDREQENQLRELQKR